jgi:hypothetical protein
MRIQSDRFSQVRLAGRLLCPRNLACVAILTVVSSVAAVSQQQDQAAAAQPATAQPATAPTAASPADSPDTQKSLKPQSPQEKQLAEDTARLLTLANELKAEMDKSTKDTLSLSVIKKAEEVEKLAHKVRDEMKASLTN